MPNVLKTLQIAEGQTSKIWDYRANTPPNGGRIVPRACVHHIPVVHNQDGRGDFDHLRRVLQEQGLMVQFSTDADGNVAMYTRANRLCYHAKGANSVTCGIEHMHYSVHEPWSRKQLRAAGWIVQYQERELDIPMRPARIERESLGVVKIVRTGHTTHQQIAEAAGTYGRSDPGSSCDMEYMFHAARYYKQHGHFVGA